MHLISQDFGGKVGTYHILSIYILTPEKKKTRKGHRLVKVFHATSEPFSCCKGVLVCTLALFCDFHSFLKLVMSSDSKEMDAQSSHFKLLALAFSDKNSFVIKTLHNLNVDYITFM